MTKLLICFSTCFPTGPNTSKFSCADCEVINGVKLYGTTIHFNPGTRRKWLLSFTAGRFASCETVPHPLNRTLDDPWDPVWTLHRTQKPLASAKSWSTTPRSASLLFFKYPLRSLGPKHFKNPILKYTFKLLNLWTHFSSTKLPFQYKILWSEIAACELDFVFSYFPLSCSVCFLTTA